MSQLPEKRRKIIFVDSQLNSQFNITSKIRTMDSRTIPGYDCIMMGEFPTLEQQYNAHLIIFIGSGYIYKDKVGIRGVSYLKSLIGSCFNEHELFTYKNQLETKETKMRNIKLYEHGKGNLGMRMVSIEEFASSFNPQVKSHLTMKMDKMKMSVLDKGRVYVNGYFLNHSDLKAVHKYVNKPVARKQVVAEVPPAVSRRLAVPVVEELNRTAVRKIKARKHAIASPKQPTSKRIVARRKVIADEN